LKTGVQDLSFCFLCKINSALPFSYEFALRPSLSYGVFKNTTNCDFLKVAEGVGWAEYSETQHSTSQHVVLFLRSSNFIIVGFRSSTQPIARRESEAHTQRLEEKGNLKRSASERSEESHKSSG